MGMSASQARLMTLTARLSDLEHSAQVISNAKIRLADNTEDAATKYSAALDAQKLTVYSSDTNSYIDATAANLTSYQGVSSLDKQRFIVNAAGQVLTTTKTAAAYDKAIATTDALRANMASEIGPNVHSLEEYIAYSMGQRPDTAGLKKDDKGYDEWANYYSNQYNALESFLNSNGCTTNPDNTDTKLSTDKSKIQYYTNIFNEIKENGKATPGDDNMIDSEWLYKQVQNGTVFIQNWDYDGGEEGLGDFVNVPWESGDSSVREEDDKSGIAKAQAEYDMDMARIHSKDKKYDLALQQIDTEHTAIQTEIDSVKKVISKNIERSFKIFDA